MLVGSACSTSIRRTVTDKYGVSVAEETVVVAADPAVVPLSCNRTHAFAMSNRLISLEDGAALDICSVLSHNQVSDTFLFKNASNR